MFFGIFKKKDCPIHEEYFLKIEWNGDFSLKNSEIHSIVEIVDREDHSVKLEESLPFLTFAHAESLFLEIKRTFVSTGRVAEFPINKLSVVHREENESPSTEGEVFISNFAIKEDYQNILKLLVEAIIFQNDFNDGSLSYDMKRSYMMDTIYPNYQASLGVSDHEILPVFPSEQEINMGTAEVIVPAFDPKPEFDQVQEVVEEQNYPQETQIEEQTEQYEGEENTDSGSVDAEAVNPPEYSFVDELLNENTEPEQYSQTKPIVHERVFHTNSNIYQNDVQTLTTTSAEVSFPKFEEDFLEKKSYEPYEEGYVAYRLNELKTELNKKIQENEARNNELAVSALIQQIKNFESLEMQKINKIIAEADKRNEIRPAIMETTSKRKQKEWIDRKSDIQTEKENALEVERLRYEKAVKEIENKFTQETKQLKAELDKTYLEAANNEYQEKYYSETGKLHNLLEIQLEKLEQRKAEKQLEIEGSLKNTGQKIGRELFDQCKNYLDSAEQQIISEHRYAKQLHLVERQEEMKRTNEQQMADYLEQLQKENASLRKDRDNQVFNQQNLENELIDTKEKLIKFRTGAYLEDYESRNAEKKLQVAETAQANVPAAPASIENDINEAKNQAVKNKDSRMQSFLVALAVILSLAACLLGFFGYRVNQVHSELTSPQGVLAKTNESNESKETKDKEELSTQQSKSEERIIQSIKESNQGLKDFSSRLENVERGINSLVGDSQQEEYNFPIVEGGTPTNRYFTGKGTITNH